MHPRRTRVRGASPAALSCVPCLTHVVPTPLHPQTGLHVDFAPTVLTLAGVGGNNLASKALDGTPLGLVRGG